MKFIVQVEQDADGKWRLDLFSPFKSQNKNQPAQKTVEIDFDPVSPVATPQPPATSANTNKIIAAVLGGCALIAAFVCVAAVAVGGTLLYYNSPLRPGSQPNPYALATATSTEEPTSEPTLEGIPTEEITPSPTVTEELPIETSPSPTEEFFDFCPTGCTEQLPGCDIKAKISSEGFEMVYYKPDHAGYASIEMDPDAGDRWFCVETSAQSESFTPAQ